MHPLLKGMQVTQAWPSKLCVLGNGLLVERRTVQKTVEVDVSDFPTVPESLNPQSCPCSCL